MAEQQPKIVHGKRVLVEVIPENENMTNSGIVMVSPQNDLTVKAKVLGWGKEANLKLNEDDIVYFNKYSLVPLKVNGLPKEAGLVEDTDILLIEKTN